MDRARIPRKVLQLKKESCGTGQNKMVQPGNRNIKRQNSWPENEKETLGRYNT
jgi:hypothetical protein